MLTEILSCHFHFFLLSPEALSPYQVSPYLVPASEGHTGDSNRKSSLWGSSRRRWEQDATLPIPDIYSSEQQPSLGTAAY